MKGLETFPDDNLPPGVTPEMIDEHMGFDKNYQAAHDEGYDEGFKNALKSAIKGLKKERRDAALSNQESRCHAFKDAVSIVSALKPTEKS